MTVHRSTVVVLDALTAHIPGDAYCACKFTWSGPNMTISSFRKRTFLELFSYVYRRLTS
jgi:hypothetical protein